MVRFRVEVNRVRHDDICIFCEENIPESGYVAAIQHFRDGEWANDRIHLGCFPSYAESSYEYTHKDPVKEKRSPGRPSLKLSEEQSSRRRAVLTRWNQDQSLIIKHYAAGRISKARSVWQDASIRISEVTSEDVGPDMYANFTDALTKIAEEKDPVLHDKIWGSIQYIEETKNNKRFWPEGAPDSKNHAWVGALIIKSLKDVEGGDSA